MNLNELLENNPVIIAIKNDEDLEVALTKESDIIFLLYGDILNMDDTIQRIIDSGKKPFVHIDMINGLNQNPVVVSYIKNRFRNKCGILTTRINLINQATKEGIPCVYRMFIMDSIALKNEINLLGKMKNKPDAVEIMPGVIPKIIAKFKEEAKNISVVAGGLIENKEEIMSALNSGATSISTSRRNLWE